MLNTRLNSPVAPFWSTLLSDGFVPAVPVNAIDPWVPAPILRTFLSDSELAVPSAIFAKSTFVWLTPSNPFNTKETFDLSKFALCSEVNSFSFFNVIPLLVSANCDTNISKFYKEPKQYRQKA